MDKFVIRKPFEVDLLRKVLKEKFGYDDFKEKQLDAVNAVLKKEDCFILMGTGAGKSICFQLPALMAQGLTVVITPLKSLMTDQLHKLELLNIPAAEVSSASSWSSLISNDEENNVWNVFVELSRDLPIIKLLYVTPEMIIHSKKLQSILTSLQEKRLLQRFVLDEAHCVSTWGHDFRPAYKELSILRQKYSNTSIVLFSATATLRVRYDVLMLLGIYRVTWVISTFNRGNLLYSVVEKRGGDKVTVAQQVTDLINRKFRNESGIVYCFSRVECDEFTDYLDYQGIKVKSYHAGLSDERRTEVQSMWNSEVIKVVCATIAFGMGIDKSNVRFVIHTCLASSLENYYQESGRAGRDGQPAKCILLYRYKDVHRHRRNIDAIEDEFLRKLALSNLLRMAAYCENRTDCRRYMLLKYLSEEYKTSDCVVNKESVCDNCSVRIKLKIIDVTEDSFAILEAVTGLNARKNVSVTLRFCADLFKGSNLKYIRENGFRRNALFARGKSWFKEDIERLFRKLIIEEFLAERIIYNRDITCVYLELGPRAAELSANDGTVRVYLGISEEIYKPLRRIDIPSLRTTSTSVPSSSASSSGAGLLGAGSTAAPAVATNLQSLTVSELHNECFLELMKVTCHVASANGFASEVGSPVLESSSASAISILMPLNEQSLLKFPFVTQSIVSNFGRAIIAITTKYAGMLEGILNRERSLLFTEKRLQRDGSWNEGASARSSASFDRSSDDNTEPKESCKKRRSDDSIQ